MKGGGKSLRSRLRQHLVNDAAFTSKTAVRGAALLIPIVGPQLSEAIGILEGQWVSRRLERFMAEANSRFSALDEQKIDRSYVESEEYLDVVVGAVQAAKRSAQDEKRRWIAAVLTGAAAKDRPDDFDAQSLLDTLAGLSVHELRILRWASEIEGWVQIGYMPDELRDPDLDYHLHRLEAAGMLGRASKDLPAYGAHAEDWRTFLRTETLLRLMAVIKVGGGLGDSSVGH